MILTVTLTITPCHTQVAVMIFMLEYPDIQVRATLHQPTFT